MRVVSPDENGKALLDDDDEGLHWSPFFFLHGGG
jgi:hypothetical protein